VSSPFTQPEFIAALYRKLCELRTRSESTEVESSGALWFYRYWMVERTPLKKMLREHLQAVLDANNAHYRKCERLLAREALQIYRTGDLAAYKRWGAIFNRNVKYQTSAYRRLDWPECYCAVILQSLIKGKVPIKKEVAEGALHEMALRLLPAGASDQAIAAEIKKLRRHRPKRPSRIFKFLGCSGLPTALPIPGRAYRY
jgi:hypothetical protein